MSDLSVCVGSVDVKIYFSLHPVTIFIIIIIIKKTWVKSFITPSAGHKEKVFLRNQKVNGVGDLHSYLQSSSVIRTFGNLRR